MCPCVAYEYVCACTVHACVYARVYAYLCMRASVCAWAYHTRRTRYPISIGDVQVMEVTPHPHPSSNSRGNGVNAQIYGLDSC